MRLLSRPLGREAMPGMGLSVLRQSSFEGVHVLKQAPEPRKVFTSKVRCALPLRSPELDRAFAWTFHPDERAWRGRDEPVMRGGIGAHAIFKPPLGPGWEKRAGEWLLLVFLPPMLVSYPMYFMELSAFKRVLKAGNPEAWNQARQRVTLSEFEVAYRVLTASKDGLFQALRLARR